MAGPALAATRPAPTPESLATVPVFQLPVLAVQQGLSQRDHKSQPRQFAVSVPVQLGLANGLWDQPLPGQARWRLRLNSPGALSLHVHLDQLRLPPGAALWFYDERGSLVQGPLSADQQTADGRLATAIVWGDAAALELQVPVAQREAVALLINEVLHGYADPRDPRASGSIAKAGAGACERDFACPESAGWEEPGRSAVLLQIGSALCSGQLINNTRGDQIPWVLTARHCGINANNASTVVAYFNFQRSGCGSGSSSMSQSISGASFRRSDTASDSALIRLTQSPPASFRAFFSGWDASGTRPDSGVGIHHPEGAEKSISVFNTPAERMNGACAAGTPGNCSLTVDSWEVYWNSGVTERGSSGSGLWNQNRQLVGVLSGGASDCNGASGNGEPDLYGRFEIALKNGFAQDLDPTGSGTTQLSGLDSSTSTGGGTTTGGSTPTPAADGGGGSSLGPALLALLLLACRRSRHTGR